MKISVEVNGAQERHLNEVARKLNVRPEELASAAIHDLLAQSEADFQTAAERVVKRNHELYRRLA